MVLSIIMQKKLKFIYFHSFSFEKKLNFEVHS
jgi:hypothetical protein